MSQTSRLGLPLLDAAQAQKHVTHNEAIVGVDALVHLAVSARAVTTPPATPNAGDRVLVGTGATGVFTGRDGMLAAFDSGGWAFTAPRAGWRMYVANENAFLLFDGSVWVDLGLVIRSLENLAALGVGTTSDSTNAFAAKLNGALFTARSPAEGGTGDVRVVLNKSTPTSTASTLYQTGYSGRAEAGLAGEDGFHIKVSADGSAWHDGLSIDPGTGQVHFPSGLVGATSAQARAGTDDASALTPLKMFQAFGAAYAAWFAGLPVYAGSGPAPVPTGQPYNNGDILIIAQ